jgi:hypothetical protein
MHVGARQQHQGAIICAPAAVASAVMMPALQQQQWQWRQGNVRDDASAVMTTMPKRCQGDVWDDATATMAMMPKRRQGDGRNDASAAMTPAPQQQQWQQCQGNVP